MSSANGPQLPPGWAVTELETVVNVLDGARVPVNANDRANRPGSIPYYGATGQVGWIDDFLFDETLVLLGEDGAPFFDKTRHVAYVVTGKSWVNNHAHVLRAVTGIDASLLRHQLNVVDYHNFVTGTTRWKLNQAPMRKIPLSLPPTVEQARIADTLDELFSDLDAGVAALERIRDKLKLYRASVLKAAVEGAMTADWRERHPQAEPASELLQRILAERHRRWEEDQLRKFEEKGKAPPKNWKAKYKEPVAPDTTNLPQLPEGWCWATIDTLILEGPQNGLYLPSTLYGRGTEILRIDDFQNGWVRPREELKRVEADQEVAATYALHDRDLVINRVNSMTHLGKCVLATQLLEGVLFESNMMRARIATASEAKYVELYLHSDSGRQRLTKDAKWAVNQASINQQDVKSTLLPLPPLAEQEVIVEAVEDQLSVIEHLETDLDAKLKSAQGLRQAILRHAFTGKLVPQDPIDEPASELLKRIAAEREARAKKAAAAKRAARKTNGSGTGRRGRPRKRKDKVG